MKIYSTFKHKVTSTLKLLKLLCDDVYISKTFLFLEMIDKVPLPLSFFSFNSFIKLLELIFFPDFELMIPLLDILVSFCFFWPFHPLLL